MNTLAPIALFLYDRPDKTRGVLESLSLNPELQNSEFHIFCDGPKSQANLNQQDQIRQVREIVEGKTWSNSTYLHFRDTNLGLANSIREGVSKVLEDRDRIIVLEDDLVVSPAFLGYHNYYLKSYEKCPFVSAICGYTPARPLQCLLSDTFLAKYFDCWGWSCHRHTWESINWDARSLYADLASFPDKKRHFDLDGCADFSTHLEANIKGELETWAIFMAVSIYLNGGKCLFSSRSFVRNSGFDGTGNHCTEESGSLFAVGRLRQDLPTRIPTTESRFARWYLKLFFRHGKKSTFLIIASSLIAAARSSLGKVWKIIQRRKSRQV